MKENFDPKFKKGVQYTLRHYKIIKLAQILDIVDYIILVEVKDKNIINQ